MTNSEYKERIEFHLRRAKEKEYDALTVETKVLEKAYELLLSGQYSNRHRENQESESDLRNGNR